MAQLQPNDQDGTGPRRHPGSALFLDEKSSGTTVLATRAEIKFREYREIEFFHFAAEVVQQYEGVDTDTASRIAEAVWKDLKSRDVRDAVRIARMLEDSADLPNLIALLKRMQ